MDSLRTFGVTVLIAVGLAVTTNAQQPEHYVVTMASSKFVTPAGFPTCTKTAIQRGDPTTGPSVILVKLTKGCFTPWHWHHTNEGGVVVSGRIKLEVKGEAPQYLVAGDYFYNPSKHPHQTTCVSTCLLSETSDSARDIHYIDSAGKEISAEEAWKITPKP